MRKPVVIIFMLLANMLPVKACSAQSLTADFVAMEYRGISNLVYKVYVTKTSIIGIRANGYISVENSFGIGYTVPKDKLTDPYAYINKDLENKYKAVDIRSDTILAMDKENFIILKKDIRQVYHNTKNKWGMAYYPYNGRIIIKSAKTPRNRRAKRDLILVGEQDEKRILEILK